MYQTINGWTKESMKAQIRKYNNGTRAGRQQSSRFLCAYMDNTGNRCAVGCFIPDGHRALHIEADVGMVLNEFKDLISIMPLEETALEELQQLHDRTTRPVVINVATELCNWIDDNVEDTV